MKNWTASLTLILTIMAGFAFGCQSTSKTDEGISAKNMWTYDAFLDARLKDQSIQSFHLKSNQRIKLPNSTEAVKTRSTSSFDYEGTARAYVEVRKPDGKRITVTEPDRWFSI